MLGIGERHELPTILLIDDDLVSREVIATVLTLDGYAVHTAEDGDDALALLGEVAPGLVLMDAQLPKLSGKALVKSVDAAGLTTRLRVEGAPSPCPTAWICRRTGWSRRRSRTPCGTPRRRARRSSCATCRPPSRSTCSTTAREPHAVPDALPDTGWRGCANGSRCSAGA